MRPKFISLLAVSALVLVGCSSPAPSPEATATAAPTAPTPTASASPKPSTSVNPNAQAEKLFAEFAVTRAGAHGASEKLKTKDTVKALHSFCEDGKPFKISKTEALNKNLEVVAEDTYCNMLK